MDGIGISILSRDQFGRIGISQVAPARFGRERDFIFHGITGSSRVPLKNPAGKEPEDCPAKKRHLFPWLGLLRAIAVQGDARTLEDRENRLYEGTAAVPVRLAATWYCCSVAVLHYCYYYCMVSAADVATPSESDSKAIAQWKSVSSVLFIKGNSASITWKQYVHEKHRTCRRTVDFRRRQSSPIGARATYRYELVIREIKIYDDLSPNPIHSLVKR